MPTQNIIKLRIPGERVQTEKPMVWQSAYLKVDNVRSYTLGITRGEAKELPIEEAQVDDVIEVELENGLRFWTTPTSLRDEVFAELGIKRGTTDEVFDIPMNLPQRNGERGFGEIVIKALRFFGVRFAERKGARDIALMIEAKGLKDGCTKLYCCGKTEQFELIPAAEKPIPTDKPVLLLLHGTGSSTAGSFGELWGNTDDNWNRRDSWLALLKRYDTVLALEHRSLTENPIQNVITLVDSLPDGITLHVVSHSRGGMVGELLCRGSASDGQPPFSKTELELFRNQNQDGSRGDLDKLNGMLQNKRIRVERFVRTACPTRGTTLASGRLDIYFSVLRALLSLTPIAGEVLSGLAALAAGIAAQRRNPQILPGIEAMIPSSPLVNLLNFPTARVDGRLRVISGDIQGGTLSSTLMVLLTDPLYQTDHDLVVNTDSMFSGAQRKDGAAYVFYRGPEISHFKYFTNQPSVKKLEAALSADATVGDGFTSYDIKEKVKPVASRGIRSAPRATVFLLPGIMGSHLDIGSNRIWMDVSDLAVGGMAKLKLGVFNVEAEEVIGSAYNPMIELLSGSYDVETFPYDWRLSVTEAAAKLARALTKKLDELKPLDLPISIVAHSMGGVVFRAMMANHPNVWERMCKHKDARVVMLGTPNSGSHAMGMVLTGQDGLIRRLALLDFKHNLGELLDIIREYPGVFEMLPYELLDPKAWETDESSPAAAMFKNAKAVWDKIKTATQQLDPKRFFYIAGQAPATPNSMRREGGKFIFEATPQGDGRVPWATGIPTGIRTWYANSLHGDLCKSEKCTPAVLDILRHGNTDRLPSVAPGNRGLPAKFVMPSERAVLHPNHEELLAAALCAQPEKLTTHASNKIRVRVVHGSLEFASYPILLGHYCGDTLVSAEAALDRHMGGRLLASQRLGLYPGNIDTAQYFTNDGHKPKGAIIVGLGDVGELTPGSLEKAVSRGIRTYATSHMNEQEKYGTPPTGVSVLLVGTNDAGLSVTTAIAAILRGIDKALQNIEKHGLADSMMLEEVELIELYEDIAIHAAHALEDASKDADLTRRFEFDAKAQIDHKRGAMRRASTKDSSDWWQRLGINEDAQGQLKFQLLTDRARAETYLQPSQRKLVDQFIADALADNTPGNSAASTLFQMLTPNNIKQYAPEQRNLLLVLNDTAARYPWELMAARTSDDKDASITLPMSVRAGMLRQLQVNTFREKVTHSPGKSVLVIGNPKIANRRFSNLPGAANEAKEVVVALKAHNYNPVQLIETEAKKILSALYADDYRILHLSGHGVYDYEVRESDDPCLNKNVQRVSGMVIGDDLFITPAEIRQMTVVPELAFINCCHLGKIDDHKIQNLPSLAANLGAELISMGVRAVIAAGWAVNDEGAKLFAAAFYEAMLTGKNFGYAVRKARQAVFNNNPNDNTWGAYQCYGDPSFVLGDGGNCFKPVKTYSFVTPSEAVIELNNLIAEACTAPESKLCSIQQCLQAIHDALPQKWLSKGEVLSALGQAWGELGQYEKAVEHLSQSLVSVNGETTLKDIEQLCNFRARWAVKIESKGNNAEAMKLLEHAETDINKVIGIGATPERWAIHGGVIKRRALILSKQINFGKGDNNSQAELIADLNTISVSYGNAAQLLTDNNQKPDAYYLLNLSATKILLSMLQKSKLNKDALQSNLNKARTASTEKDANEPCFWNAIASIECDLLEGLANKTLHSRVDDIVKGYLDAKQRDGSPREFLSAKEHLDYLIAVAEAAGSQKAESIRKIRDRLN